MYPQTYTHTGQAMNNNNNNKWNNCYAQTQQKRKEKGS